MHRERETHLGEKVSGLERHYVKKLECRIVPRRHTSGLCEYIGSLLISVSMYSALMSGSLKTSQVEARLIF